ncbi:NAD-dependent epimerase/dehydratase family protein [Tamlana fucoidanivorans]|uniref:NAD-dependent epimerase/dehydratase family protein n=1 Tax=Allotamlana fucoidanivorans TaxID=2583814 RepID=A0A5C4SJY6_9FLAO|nr:NAD-dependent epimerase/dehydratase family protein [Tamlana fucoidanivorans]TNJ44236.1 NAD-dependent epimerase/dehydratase family protein [Tamlana fucoidanivorans]
MILVTGGTGLVGAHLLYRLVSTHKKVRAIYRNEKKLTKTKQVFAGYTKNSEALFNTIEWVMADILDISALDAAFKNVTHVYHCAAFVSFEPDKYHLLRKINIEGTANIVNLAMAHQVTKLCYASSVATLGRMLNNAPITESTFWNPEAENTVYAITKYGAEMEVWRATQEGLNAVMVNPGVILGAGIWQYGSGSLFKRAHRGLKYFSSGTVALVAVEDVVAIMIKLMESDIHKERFILVAENWTYKDFLCALAHSVNAKPPKALASKRLLNIAWRLDWLKQKLTGKSRVLTKQLTHAISSEKNFSSEKVIKALDYNFKPIDSTISQVGQHYLKQE